MFARKNQSIETLYGQDPFANKSENEDKAINLRYQRLL